VGYHRKLRGKRVARSELEVIPSIGEKKKQALLRYFGSDEKLRVVNVEEIVKVPEIGKKMQKKCGGISENRWKTK